MRSYIITAAISMLIGILACFFIMRRIEPVRPSQATISAAESSEVVTARTKTTTTKTTKPDTSVVEIVETERVESAEKATSARVSVPPAPQDKPRFRVGYLHHVSLIDPLPVRGSQFSILAGMRLGQTNSHALVMYTPVEKQLSLGLSIDF